MLNTKWILSGCIGILLTTQSYATPLLCESTTLGWSVQFNETNAKVWDASGVPIILLPCEKSAGNYDHTCSNHSNWEARTFKNSNGKIEAQLLKGPDPNSFQPMQIGMDMMCVRTDRVPDEKPVFNSTHCISSTTHWSVNLSPNLDDVQEAEVTNEKGEKIAKMLCERNNENKNHSANFSCKNENGWAGYLMEMNRGMYFGLKIMEEKQKYENDALSTQLTMTCS